jgi:hypothetical protein
MDEDMKSIIGGLSSKSVMVRKEAIRRLKAHLGTENSNIARLCLHYVAEHDPCYTVRNIARQACYKVDEPPEGGASWEKTFVFQSE